MASSIVRVRRLTSAIRRKLYFLSGSFAGDVAGGITYEKHEVCSICLNCLFGRCEPDPNESVAVYPNDPMNDKKVSKGPMPTIINICGHIFHEQCILKYLEQTQKTSKLDEYACPHCRQKFKIDDLFLLPMSYVEWVEEKEADLMKKAKRLVDMRKFDDLWNRILTHQPFPTKLYEEVTLFSNGDSRNWMVIIPSVAYVETCEEARELLRRIFREWSPPTKLVKLKGVAPSVSILTMEKMRETYEESREILDGLKKCIQYLKTESDPDVLISVRSEVEARGIKLMPLYETACRFEAQYDLNGKHFEQHDMRPHEPYLLLYTSDDLHYLESDPPSVALANGGNLSLTLFHPRHHTEFCDKVKNMLQNHRVPFSTSTPRIAEDTVPRIGEMAKYSAEAERTAHDVQLYVRELFQNESLSSPSAVKTAAMIKSALDRMMVLAAFNQAFLQKHDGLDRFVSEKTDGLRVRLGESILWPITFVVKYSVQQYIR
jgi:Ring finger domain